jgi:hypothetical protein
LSDPTAISEVLRDVVAVRSLIEEDDGLMPVDGALEHHQRMTVDGVRRSTADEQTITEEVRLLAVGRITPRFLRGHDELREVEASCLRRRAYALLPFLPLTMNAHLRGWALLLLGLRRNH